MINTVLFDKYKIPWIAQETGYKESYLRRVQAGHAPINRWFIRRVCDALGEQEDSLFFFEGASSDEDTSFIEGDSLPQLTCLSLGDTNQNRTES